MNNNKGENNTTEVVLETSRLILRQWKPDDWIRFKPIATNPLVIRYVGTGQLPSDEAIQAYIESARSLYRTERFCLWPLIYRANRELIGFCGFDHLWGGDEIEIGYWLAPGYWGKGLATEAARAVMQYGRDRLGLRRIVAVAQPENKASIRVMEKIGMIYEKNVNHNGIEHVFYRYKEGQQAATVISNSQDLDHRIARVVQEDIAVVPYDPQWPAMFEEEKERLRAWLPSELIGRIEHFGSTAVPGLAAKPIVDMLVEVTDLEEVKRRVVPILESKGYDYFWRPTWGDDVAPWYAWFIRRNADGIRTHHIHMVERDFEHWNRLLFRDYLIKNPSAAQEYQTLKMRLATAYPNDRVAYTKGKTEFITAVTSIAVKQSEDNHRKI